MPRRDPFWSEQKRELRRARRRMRVEPEAAAPACEILLARLDALATAAGDRKLARRARKAARPFEKRQAIERDRALLGRIAAVGVLSADGAAALEARWEDVSRRRLEAAAAALIGKPGRRLRRALARRSRSRRDPAARVAALAAASDGEVPRLPGRATDGELRRRLDLLRRRRDAAAGAAGPAVPRSGESAPEDPALPLLERWRDLRRFARRLAREREAAERRGAVTLALALDGAIAAVAAPEKEARRAAAASGNGDRRVVAFRRRISA